MVVVDGGAEVVGAVVDTSISVTGAATAVVEGGSEVAAAVEGAAGPALGPGTALEQAPRTTTAPARSLLIPMMLPRVSRSASRSRDCP